MGPINLRTGGVNQPILSDVSLPEQLGKAQGGFDEPKVIYTEEPSSIETEGLGAIPEEEPVRDDALGLSMREAFNLPPPTMPRFE